MKTVYFIILISSLLIASCKQSATSRKEQADTIDNKTTGYPEDLSIINLIANPEKYDGKSIRVNGYLHLEFEGNMLYLHKVDYEKSLSKNALWMDFSKKSLMALDKEKCNDKYVLVEGVFNSNNTGHMGMNTGSIEKITRLEVWDFPPAPPHEKKNSVKFPPPK
ncbi:hypothetical protein [Mucilaginibacter limnophilus]|uniref:hypothetical protein n=1 Tax=Mucilaginibacter limnophilus TaxID=1932778 RepID=UPI0013E3BB13|nr:hypothetical protein [Mucilaginibacter limnophilus]